MAKIFKLLMQGIYPSLFLYFVYVFAKAFVDGLEKREICDFTAIAAFIFFVAFVVGVIGYIVNTLSGRNQKKPSEE